jgi:AcrR family transcriptional regulator
MPRGSTGRRIVTRERLLASAPEVFAERGFHAASIEDVCGRAGLTRGAFYSNFSTKSELFLALLEARSELFLTRLRAALAQALTQPDPVSTFLALAGAPDQDEHRWYVLSLEFTLQALREPAAAVALAAHDAAIEGEVGGILRALVESTGRELTVPPELLARFAAALYKGAAAQVHRPDQRALERFFLPVVLDALSREVGPL